MPTLLAPRDRLFSLIGKTFTDQQFDELCFSFGIELDEITSDKSIYEKEHTYTASTTSHSQLSDEILYRIEIPANRYDLLSTEGLAIALKSYLNIGELPPKYEISNDYTYTAKVLPKASEIRPYLFSAILKDITFDSYSYESFIKYQDKLHQTIGRNRSMVAIGTHDLDTIKPPFVYDGVYPENIAFIPLNQSRIVKGTELIDFYSSDLKIRKFLPLIQNKPYFPLIFDSEGTVCSLPPIINGDKSKITLNTKNVFIEVTSTDAIKGEATLKAVVSTFSLYANKKFSITPVQVQYSDPSYGPFGKDSWSIADCCSPIFNISLSEATKCLKVALTKEKLMECLNKMMYLIEENPDVSSFDDIEFLVTVPLNRTDILHKCDIFEDVAIAYGFENIPKTFPTSSTIAIECPLNKFSDQIRFEMALSGFTEALTLTLCSIDDLTIFLNKDSSAMDEIVTVSNPKSIETQAVRNTLLPGLLKTIASNKAVALPISIFEVSDVVLKTKTSTTTAGDNIGAKNQRRLAALYAGQTSGFEVVHSGLDRIMAMLSVQRVYGSQHIKEHTYTLCTSESPSYLSGRYAHVYHGAIKVGEIGVIHPTVLKHFDIPHAISFFEISLESFL